MRMSDCNKLILNIKDICFCLTKKDECDTLYAEKIMLLTPPSQKQRGCLRTINSNKYFFYKV